MQDIVGVILLLVPPCTRIPPTTQAEDKRRNRLGKANAMQTLFVSYRDMVKGGHDCPVCHRGFTEPERKACLDHIEQDMRVGAGRGGKGACWKDRMMGTAPLRSGGGSWWPVTEVRGEKVPLSGGHGGMSRWGGGGLSPLCQKHLVPVSHGFCFDSSIP